MAQLILGLIFLAIFIYLISLVILYIIPISMILGTVLLIFVAIRLTGKAKLGFGILSAILAIFSFSTFSNRASELRIIQSTQVKLEAQKEAAEDLKRKEENRLYEKATQEYEIRFTSPQTGGEYGIYVAAYNENGEEVTAKGTLVDVMYLLEGRYKLVMSAEGYEPERTWITVPQQKNIQVNFGTKLPPEQPLQAVETTQSIYFGSCAEARAAGAAPLYANSAGYSSKLDRDGDGVACE